MNISYSSLSGSQPRGMSRNEILRSTVLSYGHVTAACFTEDGHRLLSAIGDGQIRVTQQHIILLISRNYFKSYLF